MNKILDSDSFDKTFTGARDRLILELLYGTGIRESELIGLKESDINLCEHTIKVQGKRNKERVIPFPKTIAPILEEYCIKKNKEVEHKNNALLLVTDKGKSLYPMLVYRIVRKRLGVFSAMEKRSPHVLRHTYATQILNRGADINAVKDLLGHSNLAATQIYTHNSIEKLKKVFNQAHPKA